MIIINEIGFSNITYSAGEKIIINNISFYLKKNAVNILVGPNGAGKTSLLEVLAGIRKTELDIDNSEILYLNLDYLIFDKLTVKEFIQLIIKINQTINYEMIFSDFKELKIGEFIDTKLEFLSLGQKQKLLILTGIMSNKHILLFDEPYNGLDKNSKLVLNNLFKKYKKNKTFFFATHDVEIINNIVDHIVKLNNGVIVE